MPTNWPTSLSWENYKPFKWKWPHSCWPTKSTAELCQHSPTNSVCTSCCQSGLYYIPNAICCSTPCAITPWQRSVIDLTILGHGPGCSCRNKNCLGRAEKHNNHHQYAAPPSEQVPPSSNAAEYHPPSCYTPPGTVVNKLAYSNTTKHSNNSRLQLWVLCTSLA